MKCIPIIRKASIAGILATLLLASGGLFAANSGTFCNDKNELVEFLCGVNPSGPGWVRQADGCFHRVTGQRCGDTNRPTPPNRPPVTPPNRPTPPPPSRPDRPPMPPPSRPDRPDRPGYPGHDRYVTCSARKDGWDKHLLGHGSCQECMSKHDQCIETCSRQNVQCEAQGTDYRGNILRFVGQAGQRSRAENEALKNCSYNAGNCRVVSCSTQDETISRRYCR